MLVRPWMFLSVAVLFALDGAMMRAAFAETSVGVAQKKVTPFVETFDDLNKDNRRQRDEPFEDRNGNGRFDKTYMAGYGQNRPALGVHDDLWARALCVERDGEVVVFCALDFVGFAIDRVAGIKQRVRLANPAIPWNRMLISSTHNHHGPDTMGLWGPFFGISGVDMDYMAWAQDRAAEAILEAYETREPARLFTTEAKAPHVVKDIHEPKITDPTLALLMARSARDGRVIGHLWNFAAHAEVLDPRNPWITADYPHYLCAKAEKDLGGMALFFPAAVGGMQTPDTKGTAFEDAQWAGEELARLGVEALRQAKPDASTRFFAVAQRLDLPVSNLRFTAGIELGFLGAKNMPVPRKNGVIHVPSEVALVRLGSAEFITVPGELFPETGFRFKERMTGTTKFILGLNSNEIGYIVPEEIWTPTMYEATMSLGKETCATLSEFILAMQGADEKALRAQEVPNDGSYEALPVVPPRTSDAGVQHRHATPWDAYAKARRAPDDEEF